MFYTAIYHRPPWVYLGQQPVLAPAERVCLATPRQIPIIQWRQVTQNTNQISLTTCHSSGPYTDHLLSHHALWSLQDVEVTSPPDDSISCLAFSPPTLPGNFLIGGSWANDVSRLQYENVLQSSCCFFLILPNLLLLVIFYITSINNYNNNVLLQTYVP